MTTRFVHSPLSNNDWEMDKCIKLLGAVIATAVEDVRRKDKTAVEFFSSPDSPFWEICDQIGIDPSIILTQAMR